MKQIAPLICLALLTACGGDETGQTDPGFSASETGTADTGAAGKSLRPAADGGPVHGMFQITDPDNEISVEYVKQDGTLSISYADGTVETGTWWQRAPNLFCVKMDYDGAEAGCFEESINADGVWVSRDPVANTISQVVRMEQPDG